MKTVALVAYDDFTDIDLFLAWDLMKRVPGLDVQIVAPTPTITSSTGVTITAHGGLDRVAGADGVYITSGAGSRAIAKDAGVLAQLAGVAPGRQVVAAVDSGVLILAALGHLRGKRATTYPAPDLHEALAGHGVVRCDRALVVEGDVATAAQCLAGVDLVAWFVTRLVGAEAADASVASVRPLAEASAVHVEAVALRSAEATWLIAELDAELTTRYPEDGANHFELATDEVAPGTGAFVVAHADGALAGCGAVRLLDGGAAEIKRMYTRPSMRGRGVARAILDHLELVAARLGATRLVLETGARQPEAVDLYRRHGFVEIPPFGAYVDSPLSVCMAKVLGAAR